MAQITRKLFHQEDDDLLKQVVQEVGEDNWNEVSERMKIFTPRQCKERYTIYLKNEYRTDPWTDEEDALLIELYDNIGPKWREISEFFNGRHVNSVKNRWYRYIQHGSKKSIEKYEQECLLKKQKEEAKKQKRLQAAEKKTETPENEMEAPMQPPILVFHDDSKENSKIDVPQQNSIENSLSPKKPKNDFEQATDQKMDDLKFDFLLNDFLYK